MTILSSFIFPPLRNPSVIKFGIRCKEIQSRSRGEADSGQSDHDGTAIFEGEKKDALKKIEKLKVRLDESAGEILCGAQSQSAHSPAGYGHRRQR